MNVAMGSQKTRGTAGCGKKTAVELDIRGAFIERFWKVIVGRCLKSSVINTDQIISHLLGCLVNRSSLLLVIEMELNSPSNVASCACP